MHLAKDNKTKIKIVNLGSPNRIHQIEEKNRNSIAHQKEDEVVVKGNRDEEDISDNDQAEGINQYDKQFKRAMYKYKSKGMQ